MKNKDAINKSITIERSTKAYYSTTSLLKKLEYSFQVVVLKNDLIESNKFQSRELDIPLASNVYEIKRLLIVEDRPRAIESSFIAAENIPEFYNVDLNNKPLYSLLNEKYGIEIDKSDERIIVTEAKNSEKELLKLEEDHVIVITGKSYDRNEKIIELYETVALCDFFEFKGDTLHYDK